MSQEYEEDGDDTMEEEADIDALDAAFDEAFDEATDEEEEAAGEGQDGTAAQHDNDSVSFMNQANQNLADEDYDNDEYNPSQQQQGVLLDSSAPAQAGSSAVADRRPADTAQPTEDLTAKKRQDLFDSLTEEQKDRYEAFMRAALPKQKIKKLMQTVLGAAPPEKAVIAMSGICKLHLGEIVEAARELASQEGYDGPLLPKHIRRAYQALHTQAKVPHFRHPRKRKLLKQ